MLNTIGDSDGVYIAITSISKAGISALSSGVAMTTGRTNRYAPLFQSISKSQIDGSLQIWLPFPLSCLC